MKRRTQEGSRKARRAIFVLDDELTREDRRWVIFVLSRRETDDDGRERAQRAERKARR